MLKQHTTRFRISIDGDGDSDSDDQVIGELRMLFAARIGLNAAHPTRLFSCPGLLPTCLMSWLSDVKIGRLIIAHGDPTLDAVPAPAMAAVEAALADVERGAKNLGLDVSRRTPGARPTPRCPSRLWDAAETDVRQE